ncbi:MAG: SDR family NAD(P)-dependent oxidoreductase [Bacillota bacterium]
MQFPEFNLNGRVALVTGSTKGIGYGIALGMARAGADLVIVSRNQADCDRVAGEITGMGRRSAGIAADITQNEQVLKLVERAVAEFGRVDILVNNAGTAITRKAEDLTEADFDRVVGLDQRAVFFVAQAVGRQMIRQGGGRIINVASILGLVGERQVLPYCVAKGGVIQMTRALALEWAKYNINVNALCPGYVITPMNEADLKDEKIYSHLVKSIPMRRLGRLEDMAGAAVFIASDAAGYMTGQCLVVDGGWTAQ